MQFQFSSLNNKSIFPRLPLKVTVFQRSEHELAAAAVGADRPKQESDDCARDRWNRRKDLGISICLWGSREEVLGHIRMGTALQGDSHH